MPYNVIVGPGYQVYLTGAGFDEAASRAAIDKAMANFAFYPKNLLPSQLFAVNTETVIDLSNVIYNTTGQTITYSVTNISDNSVITDAVVEGTGLRITTGQNMGISELSVKGTAGTFEANFNISVELYDPGMTEQLYESYDLTWPPEGWALKTATTGAGWIQSDASSITGGFSACHADDTGVQNDWIYSPKVKITGKTILSFWQKGLYTSSYVSHGVAYSLDMIRPTWIYPNLPTSAKWEQVFIDLSAYNGKEIYIGFNYQGDYSDVWFIDDVRLWTVSGIEEENMPSGVKLFQNYPNPFNPSTEISFSLDTERSVRLSILNSKGEFVSEITNGSLGKGVHKFNFNAEKLNSGIYFYTLEFDNKKLVNKMLLIK